MVALGDNIDTRWCEYLGGGISVLGNDADTKRGISLGRVKNLYPFGKCFLCFTLSKFLPKKDQTISSHDKLISH